MVLGRTSGIFLSAPIFSARQLPVRLKVLMAVVLSLIISMVAPVESTKTLNSPGIFALAVASEILVGYALGFVVYLAFAAIQLAGQLIDMQMGFGIVNVIDPQSGTQVPLVGNFQYLIALLVFLSIDGHHMIIRALYNSYKLIPVLGARFDGQFVQFIVGLAGSMFVVAVQIAAPIVAAIFLSDIALGFLARTVPQMNVFIVGLPLKIFGGLFMLLAVMSVFIWFVQILLGRFFDYLDLLIKVLGA